MTDEQLEELRKALYRHLIVLDAMLAADEKWALDLHIPIAVQLRVLLCDKNFPMLLRYAAARGMPLRVWGPRPASSGTETRLLFHFSANVASWVPLPDAHEMSIEDYLETGVAVTTLPGDVHGRAYTPMQLVKWVANKEGGAHFSFEKPPTLEVLKRSTWSSGEANVEAFEVKRIIFGVAEWTQRALVYCLGLDAEPEPAAEVRANTRLDASSGAEG